MTQKVIKAMICGGHSGYGSKGGISLTRERSLACLILLSVFVDEALFLRVNDLKLESEPLYLYSCIHSPRP